MIALFYGMPGMGKTTAMHDYIRASPSQTFFIVEHSDEWSPESVMWRGQAPPIQVIQAGQDMPEQVEPGMSYVFAGWEPIDVANLCLHYGDVVYVDDELDMTARRKGWEGSPLRHMVHRGRHYPNAQGEICTLHILGACRRPQNLSTDVTDLVDQVFIFRCQGRNTLGRLEADSMVEDGEWDTIRNLQKFHFKHWPSGRLMSAEPL